MKHNYHLMRISHVSSTYTQAHLLSHLILRTFYTAVFIIPFHTCGNWLRKQVTGRIQI